MPSAPFPTAETIITTARGFINDAAPTDAGNLLADSAVYSLTLFNAAYRYAQERLGNRGLEFSTKYATLLSLTATTSTDPSAFAYVNYTEYFDGGTAWSNPVLPSDLCQPLWVRQRLSGATQSPFLPVRWAADGLPANVQTAYFQCADWRNNQLFLTPALQSNDLQMCYQAFLPDISVFTETIPILRSENAIGALVAAFYMRSRGAPGADEMDAKADQFIRELIRRSMRRKQRGQHRRVPYGRGSNIWTTNGWGYPYGGGGPY